MLKRLIKGRTTPRRASARRGRARTSLNNQQKHTSHHHHHAHTASYFHCHSLEDARNKGLRGREAVVVGKLSLVALQFAAAPGGHLRRADECEGRGGGRPERELVEGLIVDRKGAE